MNEIFWRMNEKPTCVFSNIDYGWYFVNLYSPWFLSAFISGEGHCTFCSIYDRLCGLVVRVLGYRPGGPGSIPGTTKKKRVVGLERDPLSLVSTTEELLDRKVAAPV
jgi:hypothetical protein